jgi:hypothetical protein
VLVCIGAVDRPRALVPLLGHNPDISLDLFGILVVCYIVDLKAPEVSRKLGLNDTNRYLPLVGNVQPGDARPSTRLLHTPREPVVSPDLAVLPPQVRGDNGMRGRLAEEDLTERDNNDQVVKQELSNKCRQEPDIILELARLLLSFMVRGMQHNQPVLEVDVPPPLGVTPGDGE